VLALWLRRFGILAAVRAIQRYAPGDWGCRTFSASSKQTGNNCDGEDYHNQQNSEKSYATDHSEPHLTVLPESFLMRDLILL